MRNVVQPSKSILYIVPTPIGNLQDISYRALLVLRQVDYIIVENICRTRILLNAFFIHTPLFVLNKYNENIKTFRLIKQLKQGLNFALVSDAGTPLISDPGYNLVQECLKLKIRIIPLPGPCAAITALSGSGLPTNRFCFEGFLPSKHNLRVERLKILLHESRTLIFYDTKYRVIDTLKDIENIFGTTRYVVLARELTKIWESIYGAPVNELLSWVLEHDKRIKGEMVLIVSGNCDKKNSELSPIICNLIKELSVLKVPIKKIAYLMRKVYGLKRSVLYKQLLHE